MCEFGDMAENNLDFIELKDQNTDEENYLLIAPSMKTNPDNARQPKCLSIVRIQRILGLVQDFQG